MIVSRGYLKFRATLLALLQIILITIINVMRNSNPGKYNHSNIINMAKYETFQT